MEKSLEMEIKTREPVPSHAAIRIGTIAMTLSLAILPFIAMVSYELSKIVKAAQIDLFWSTKVLLSVGGFIGSFWCIPCAMIMIYFWFWVCQKSSRLMVFSVIYSICLIVSIEFTMRTYDDQKRIIKEFLNTR